MDLSSEAKQEVQRLLADGRKNDAIEYLQSTFQVTTEEAEQLVQVVEAELQASDLVQQQTSTALDGELKMKVITLLMTDRKIEAVKLVKSELNAGLKESMEMVEEVQKEIDPTFRPITIGKAGCVGDTFRLVGIIFGLVSLLLIGIAGMIYYFQSGTIKNAELIDAQVTDMVYSNSGGSAPIFQYQYRGSGYTHQSSTYSTPPAFNIGEKVELYVNKDNPNDVVVNTFSERWLAISIVGGLGLFFGLFAAAFFFVSKKTSAQV